MTRATEWLLGLPFALLLFVLPFPGTVALRLLCLAAIFVVAMTQWRRIGTPPLPCKAVLLAWAALALASLAYAVDPAYSLGEVKNEVGYTMMAFVAFFAITENYSKLRVWLVTALAAATLVAAWALLVAQGNGGLWDDSAAHGGRGSFASLAVAVLPLAPLLWRGLSRPGRVLLGVGIVLILMAAVVSEQRIIWAVLGVQAVVVLGLMAYAGLLRLSRFTLALLLVGCVAVAGTALLIVHERKVDQSPAEYFDLNHDFRLQQWRRIVDRIETRPLTGAGFGREAMKKAYPDLVPTVEPLTLLWHPHNVFLTYGVAMGFPGMLMLMLLFGALIARYARQLRGGSEEQRLAAIAGIALVAGVVTRNLTNDLFLRDGALLFWALNGALLGWLARSGERR